jgi:WD40 repeat protein
VWDVAGRKKLFSWQGSLPRLKDGAFEEPFSYLPVAFSPDGKVLAVGNGPRVELRSVETGGKEVLPGHYGEVRVVALSPDGRVLGTDSGDGSSRLWETTTGREITRFDDLDLSIDPAWWRWFGFSEDGNDVMMTDGAWMYHLSAATGKLKARAPLQGGGRSLAADGKLSPIGISGDAKAWLIGWAINDAHEFLDDDKTGPWSLWGNATVSTDRKTVANAYKWGNAVADNRNEQKVKVWDVATGKRLAEFDSGGPVALTPDGEILATVGDKQPWAPPNAVPGQPPQPPGKPPKVRLWDVATGKELRRLDTVAEAFGSEGLPLAFSPDGKLLATGWANGSVRLWDVATGNVVTDLKGNQGRVSSLAFSANGKLIASGGKDTTVLLWKVP